MSNMSYCRFRNTLEDLRDCHRNWEDVEDNNKEELRARDKLLELCKIIVNNYEEE